jgi:hypothetical protein
MKKDKFRAGKQGRKRFDGYFDEEPMPVWSRGKQL